MFYSDDVIAEVRSRNNIVDVVGSYVRLDKKGANYWGLCPFHGEHTPSFSVNANKQIFHCFGCGEGGNVISFIMKYENITFPEAVKELASRAGIELPEAQVSDEDKKKASRKLRLLEVNKEAATFFYRQLRTPHGEKGMQYLRGRALSDETMQKFGLGYAGMNGRDVVDYLRSKGFSDAEIKDSGLASASEKNGLSSPFWNRVMYPIMDANHRVIGFGGRVMGDAKPKYLNSPETEIFDKRRNLYGFVFARTSRAGYYILCEGYMDVIAMHQAGFNNAVASLGTALTEEQAKLLSRTSNKVLLAYDSDGAGVKAALRAIGILKGAGISARVIDMRPCKDPDEFMKTYGKEAFQERIDKAENSFYYQIRMESGNYNMSEAEGRTEFARMIAKRLCEEFPEALERDNYLQAMCEQYSINQDNMKKLVAAYAAQGVGIEVPVKPKTTITKKLTTDESGRRAQKMLLTWLTDEPEIFNKVKQYVDIEDFTEEVYKRAAQMVYKGIEEGKLDPSAIIDAFDEDEAKEVASLFQTKLPIIETNEERNRSFSDIVIRVKTNSYNCFCADIGNDMSKFTESIKRKKELEALTRTGISLS